MMQAVIRGIEYYLPARILDNDSLARQFPDWPAPKIEDKTGIAERHLAGEQECSSDLGEAAARKLFSHGVCRPEDVHFILLCTQTPDYLLPTTACVLQDRLGIPKAAGALDFNLGCSGFVYGLGLAKGLIESGQTSNVLLITAETYSKLMHPSDQSVRTIFGDAGAATFVEGIEGREDDSGPAIGPFVYGTDGAGAKNLIVRSGGMRHPRTTPTQPADEKNSAGRNVEDHLYMNGPEIFTFTLKTVPESVAKLLSAAGKNLEDIDLFVFHQANQYMLEHLRKKLKIPQEKFLIFMRNCGNTVSATIPIALKHALQTGKIRPGSTVMLVGFGVGYSWGATLIKWVAQGDSPGLP
jgi:3-oxoacyl-[acyl-carrier-protein] synthase III